MFSSKTFLTVSALLGAVATSVCAQVSFDNASTHATLIQVSASLTAPSEYAAVRLTNDGSESINPRAVVDGDYLYLTWEDTRDGNREIYWQKFNRLIGTPATSPVRITNSGASSIEPVIGIDGSGNSYIAWQEGSLYNSIWAAKVSPNGTIVTSPMAVLSGLYQDPDIAVSSTGDNVIVAHLMTASNQSVYVRRGNASLGQNCIVQLPGAFLSIEKYPAVAFDGTNSYVSFREWELFTDRMYTYLVNSTCVGGKVLQIDATPIVACTDYGASGLWVGYGRSGNVYDMLDNNSSSQVNDVAGTATYPRVAASSPHGYYVWQDSRDGNAEIYLSETSNPVQPYSDVRVTSNSASQQRPDIACSASDPGSWWVVWSDNRDGNWEIYMTSSANSTTPVTLTIKHNNGTTVLTQDAVVTQLRLDGLNWARVDEQTSDALGTVTFNNLLPGDGLFARRLLDDQQLCNTNPIFRDGRTWKQWHKQRNGVYYAFQVYDENINPDLTYETYGAGQTEILLDHRLARMNLVAGFDYDVGAVEAEQMKTHLTEAARRFYNATNGQFWIDSVTIFDRVEDAVEPNDQLAQYVDIRINRTSSNPNTIGLTFPLGQTVGETVGALQVDWNKSIPVLSDLTIFYNYLSFRVPKWHVGYDKGMFDDVAGGYSFQGTLSHELGHYIFQLMDETEDKKMTQCKPPFLGYYCTGLTFSGRASLMTYPYGPKITDGSITEYCHHENHKTVDCYRWDQTWTKEYSCWDAMKFIYPWIHAVTGDADEDFGPLTTASPRFGIDPALLTTVGLSRILRFHRPEYRIATEETIHIGVSRGNSTLFQSYYTFMREREMVETPTILDLRTNDVITVFADGYALSLYSILAPAGSIIDIQLSATGIEEGLWDYLETVYSNPNAERFHLTSSFLQSASNSDKQGSLDFHWTGHGLLLPPTLRLCPPDSECMEISLGHLHDSTFGTELGGNALDKPTSYVLYSTTLSGDSVIAGGVLLVGKGDAYVGARLTLPWSCEMYIPKSNFSGIANVLLANATDIKVVAAEGRQAIASPVVVDFSDLDTLWIDSGSMFFRTTRTGFDSSSVRVLHYQGGAWTVLPTIVDSNFGQWGATIPGDGLYALAAKPSPPSVLTLLTPLVGSRVEPKDTIAISWSGSAAAESLVVRLSLDGGKTFRYLVYRDSTPTSQSVSWVVPDTSCGDARLEVTLFGLAGSNTAQVNNIVISCCIGTTGNVDGSVDGVVDISDVFAMVDFLSASIPLSSCPAENDVNKDGTTDISDVFTLIDYLVDSVPLPVCP